MLISVLVYSARLHIQGLCIGIGNWNSLQIQFNSIQKNRKLNRYALRSAVVVWGGLARTAAIYQVRACVWVPVQQQQQQRMRMEQQRMAARGVLGGAAGGAQPPGTLARLHALLGSMGVGEAEPQVAAQLLDFTHRYVADVLTDAAAYQAHLDATGGANAGARAAAAVVGLGAEDRQGGGGGDLGGGGGVVGLEAVVLAIRSRAGVCFVPPPAQEVLAEVADALNGQPLPPVAHHRFGVLMPPERDCLVAPNYQLDYGGTHAADDDGAPMQIT